MNTLTVDKWLQFDSNLGDTIELPLNSSKEWTCNVTYISFSLPDNDVWTDPTCYLFIKMNGNITGPVIMQGKVKRGGALLPVRIKENETKVDAYFRGITPSGDTFSFELLDHNMASVTYARLVVTLHIVGN